jgi:stearoyl-CoA desaturase (delta-9 desaturase)
VHHVTWSVNSICHYYGARPFATRDESVNNWPLALLSFGESWHNNHHAFPTSARHGLEVGQLDISAAVIGLLERARLVERVRRPSPQQIASKRGLP